MPWRLTFVCICQPAARPAAPPNIGVVMRTRRNGTHCPSIDYGGIMVSGSIKNIWTPRSVPLTMRLESPSHLLELLATEVGPQDFSSAGDIRIEIQASVGEFSGKTTCCVEAHEMKRFSSSLSQLYSSFQGTAQLHSISPGELSLPLSPANSRGYVLIQVALAKLISPQRTFSAEFEVDLPSLAPLLAWSRNPGADA